MAGVAILLGTGEVRVAGRSYGIEPGADGRLRLSDGPELRPLRFGERARLSRAARAATDPAAELAASVLGAARISGGDHPAARALALHMAGAGGTDLGFAAAQSLLARQLGWTQSDVAEALAADVDALAAEWQASLPSDPDGWTRLVFAAPAPGESAQDAEALALELARDLLDRANAGIDPEILPPVGATTSQVTRALSPDAAFGVPPVTAEDVNLRPQLSGTEASAAPGADIWEDTTAAAAPLAGPQRRQSAAPPGRPTQSLRAAAAADLARPAHREAAAAPSANPTPHPGPVAQALAAFARQPSAPVAMPAADRAAAPIPASDDIWAPRPQLAARAALRARRPSAPPVASPGPQPFAGWFDDAVPAPGPLAQDRPTPAGWVWGKTSHRPAPHPDLPGTEALSDSADTVEALAEALHLAADLRGIAP